MSLSLCFDASFIRLSRFVAVGVTFTGLCSGLQSRIHLGVTDQSWPTGPNETLLHFQVVIVVR